MFRLEYQLDGIGVGVLVARAVGGEEVLSRLQRPEQGGGDVAEAAVMRQLEGVHFQRLACRREAPDRSFQDVGKRVSRQHRLLVPVLDQHRYAGPVGFRGVGPLSEHALRRPVLGPLLQLLQRAFTVTRRETRLLDHLGPLLFQVRQPLVVG
jgi:hypothetical protein